MGFLLHSELPSSEEPEAVKLELVEPVAALQCGPSVPGVELDLRLVAASGVQRLMLLQHL